MTEATNRITTTYYLNQKDLDDTEALTKYMVFVANDLNNVRPHGQLKGLTTNLAYKGQTPVIDRFLEQKQLARIKRIETHQNMGCCKIWN